MTSFFIKTGILPVFSYIFTLFFLLVTHSFIQQIFIKQIGTKYKGEYNEALALQEPNIE